MKKIYISIFSGLLLFACSGNNNEETAGSDTNQKPVAEAKQPMDIQGREVSYDADGVTMKGYMAFDANNQEKRPAVLVVHEWWGHNEHSRKSAEELAKLGYVAFAVDMYGDGKKAQHPDDAMKFSGAVMKNFDGAKDRFSAALALVKSNEMVDSSKIGAIGYCFGGGVVLNLARQGADLAGVASFHGSLGAIKPAEEGEVKAKILVMNGQDDPFVTDEQITNIQEEMANAGVQYEFVSYPGAVHAFTNPAATEMGEKFELPLAYNEQAATESWDRMKQFFEEVFSN